MSSVLSVGTSLGLVGSRELLLSFLFLALLLLEVLLLSRLALLLLLFVRLRFLCLELLLERLRLLLLLFLCLPLDLVLRLDGSRLWDDCVLALLGSA